MVVQKEDIWIQIFHKHNEKRQRYSYSDLGLGRCFYSERCVKEILFSYYADTVSSCPLGSGFFYTNALDTALRKGFATDKHAFMLFLEDPIQMYPSQHRWKYESKCHHACRTNK